MLAIEKFSADPSLSAVDGLPRDFPDLQSVLDAEDLYTHALLLLYLMPVANRSDVDASTTHAVEVLSDVQTRLSTPCTDEPFSKDALAMVYSQIAAIRFGER